MKNLVLVFLVMGACSSGGPKALTIFGAASTADVLTELAHQYERKTGTSVRLSFASSSTLARQIEAGARADLFISANPSWMDYLEERNLIRSESRRLLLTNSLVLIAPLDSDLENLEIGRPLPKLNGRLAMGDPSHVPVGIYGAQALKRMNWNPEILPSQDVRAALRLVISGEAPLGLVYASDLHQSEVRVLFHFPPDSHEIIAYPVSLLSDAVPEAQNFLSFLFSKEARKVYEQHHFVFQSTGR